MVTEGLPAVESGSVALAHLRRPERDEVGDAQYNQNHYQTSDRIVAEAFVIKRMLCWYDCKQSDERFELLGGLWKNWKKEKEINKANGKVKGI